MEWNDRTWYWGHVWLVIENDINWFGAMKISYWIYSFKRVRKRSSKICCFDLIYKDK